MVSLLYMSRHKAGILCFRNFYTQHICCRTSDQIAFSYTANIYKIEWLHIFHWPVRLFHSFALLLREI